MADRAVLDPLARLVSAVRKAAPSTSLLLVGAPARDLLLVHACGIEVQRSTEDTDLAFAVPDWPTFLRLRNELVVVGGFRPDRVLHRLWLAGQRLDILPFGGVERPDRKIAWPPRGAEVMDASGLAEAHATAVVVHLPNGVTVDVARLAALALLKVWAWSDRKYTAPGKDAGDLWIFLRHYADAGNEDRLYGDDGAAALAAYAFDVEAAGAWLLGSDARKVLNHGPAPRSALGNLGAILRPEIDPEGSLRLVGQMPPGDRSRQLSLLTAFCAGLLEDPALAPRGA